LGEVAVGVVGLDRTPVVGRVKPSSSSSSPVGSPSALSWAGHGVGDENDYINDGDDDDDHDHHGHGDDDDDDDDDG
jgi:hypothetical protein